MKIKDTEIVVKPYSLSGFVRRYKFKDKAGINLRINTDSDDKDKIEIYTHTHNHIVCYIDANNYDKFSYIHIRIVTNSEEKEAKEVAVALTEMAKAYAEYAELPNCEIDCVIVVRKPVK